MTVALKLRLFDAALAPVAAAQDVASGPGTGAVFGFPSVHYEALTCWVTYRNPNTNKHYASAYSEIFEDRFVDVDLGTLGDIPVITSYHAGSGKGILVWAGLKWRTITLAGTLGTTQTLALDAASGQTLIPASRPFYPNYAGGNMLAIWVQSQAPTYRNYYLVELQNTGAVDTGRAMVGPVARAAGRKSSAQSYETYVAHDTATKQSHWAAVVAHNGDVGDNSNLPTARLGVDRITSHFTMPRRHAARLGPGLYVAAGIMQMFDGVKATELGGFYPPLLPTLTDEGAWADALKMGTYSYRLVLEWFDDLGQRHRGAPGQARTITIGPDAYDVDDWPYALGDFVQEDGVQYKNILEDWDVTENYVIGDHVRDDDGVFVCTADNIANEPPNVTYWDEVVGAVAPDDVAAGYYWEASDEWTGKVTVGLRWAALCTREDAAIHVYRTLRNQTIHYRATPLADPPMNNVTEEWADTSPDATIDANEVLYTDQGILPYVDAPPCNLLIAALNRLLAAGLENPRQAIFSHEYFDGEPAQWSDDPAFMVSLPDPITAIATQDEAVYLFTAKEPWVVYGPGPDEQGVGAFTTPRRLPSHVGCQNQWSVVTTDRGIMFDAGNQQIYLLPRGGGSPVFVGQPMRETLALYPSIDGAVVDSREHAAIFLANAPAGDSVLLRYNYRLGIWSVDLHSTRVTTIALARLTGYLDTPDLLLSGEDFEYYDATGYPGAPVELVIQTGAIRPFGLLRHWRARKLRFVGEFLDRCSVWLGVSRDGSTWVEKEFALDLDSAQLLDLLYRVARPKCNELFLRVRVVHDGPTPTARAKAMGFSLEVYPRSGGARLAAAYRG